MGKENTQIYHCHDLKCGIRYQVTIVSPKRNQPNALFLGFEVLMGKSEQDKSVQTWNLVKLIHKFY